MSCRLGKSFVLVLSCIMIKQFLNMALPMGANAFNNGEYFPLQPSLSHTWSSHAMSCATVCKMASLENSFGAFTTLPSRVVWIDDAAGSAFIFIFFQSLWGMH
jgi:hypothetical protein